jgi:antibiotic biosynthesis monooxygenase (ABM) superfamily enzyme
MTLAQHFAAYSEWRAQISRVLEKFAGWLVENDLTDAQTDRRITFTCWRTCARTVCMWLSSPNFRAANRS